MDESTWHAGHVVADSKGGDTDLDNLRPICRHCNLHMKKKNMREFMLINGYGKLQGEGPSEIKDREIERLKKEVIEKDKLIANLSREASIHPSNKTHPVCRPTLKRNIREYYVPYAPKRTLKSVGELFPRIYETIES